MATPTLIGMPDPISNPDTPTEMPGTPNSATTSLSCISTTAIKDGHRGQSLHHSVFGHQHTPSSNTLEAERADRISRLAGLERVTAVRQTSNPNQPFPGNTLNTAGGGQQIPGYFDQNGNPVYTTKMSTVGSASATGSVSGTGQTTTWASGSNRGAGDDDEMSMDTNLRDYDDRDRYSASGVGGDEDDGMSDDTSLVGFGEGAGSTVSGPIYSRRGELGRSGLGGQLQRDESFGGMSERSAGTPEGQSRTGGNSTGVETAERIIRDRLERDSASGGKTLGTPDEAGIGKFYFEEKK